MTVTEVGYGEEYRWWENQETLYAVAQDLADYNVPARTMIDYFKTPWEFTAWYEQWFAAQVGKMTDDI